MSNLSLIDDEPFVILQDDQPILRKVSKDVTEFDESLITLIQRILATMAAYNGCGLAAVQVGIDRRVIVALGDGILQIMVNPVITRTLNRETIEKEGCLSISPTKWRKVSRPAKCEISWQDVKGNHRHGNFSKQSTRVLQHEIDHLNGILITDKPYIG